MSEPRAPRQPVGIDSSANAGDPLVEAYRHASAQDEARPSPRVRDAVLAHARIVAQSQGDPAGAATVAADATRALPPSIVRKPAANDRAWYWRAAAGLALGVAGVWIFRLTNEPASPTTTNTAVAAANAPATARAVGATGAVGSVTASETNATASATVAAAEKTVASVAATAPVAETMPAAAGAETQVAISRVPTTEAAPTSVFRSAKREALPVPQAARDGAPTVATVPAGGARIRSDEPQIALAKPAAPASSASAAPAASPVVVAAAPQAFPAASAAVPAVAASASAGAGAALPAEESVAMADVSKRRMATRTDSRADVREDGRAEPRGKVVSEAATVAAAAAIPPPPAAVAAPTMQPGAANVALFAALRAGQIDALRSAIARGANVNARDESGRTPLQIARDKDHPEMIRLLEAAGAK